MQEYLKMEALTQIESLCFDFDNVIIRGSDNFKDETLSGLFAHDEEKQIRLNHARKRFAHGKGDRYDMLGAVYGLSGQIAREDSRVQTDAGRFDLEIRSHIVEQGVHPDDEVALEVLAQRWPMHIVSNTPEMALLETVSTLRQKHPVLGRFGFMLGTPRKKPENLELIRSAGNFSFSRMVMIGDGQNDLAAAETVGSQFIGITVPENEKEWADKSFPKLGSVSQIPKLLKL